jgi:hypothetical protein
VGWVVRVEVSYAHYGERGSVDVLAFHPATRTLLIVEVKSELTSIEATLRKVDEKVRLARILANGAGWQARTAARLLVLPSTTTARRAVKRHGVILDVALPVRGTAFRTWLRRPSSQIAALLFVADNAQATGKQRVIAPDRVRRPRAGVRHACADGRRASAPGRAAHSSTQVAIRQSAAQKEAIGRRLQ